MEVSHYCTVDKPPVLHRRLLSGITAQYANGRKLHEYGGVLTEYRKWSTEDSKVT